VKTLAIAWFSRTGGSRQLAEAMQAGARDTSSTEVRLLEAQLVQPDHLLAADGYLFACPENLASMAGEMKAMFDRCYYPVLGKIEGRPYAATICAGSDGTGAQRQLERICTGWRLKRVADTRIVMVDAQTPEQILAPKAIAEPELVAARDLGAMLAAGLDLGVF
jgi:NAD(P)H-dependent FMN reductase